MSIVLQKARESGKCPPSLLAEERCVQDDLFDVILLPLLDAKAFHLNAEPETADGFTEVLEKATALSSIPGPSEDHKKATLEQRRCILLAVVGSTPSNSPSLKRVLEKGYLGLVKTWLDEILSGSVGGVDLLLQLLSSIADLPVTKSVVKDSGMGKLIGSVEKHRICKGTPNEAAIKERVEQVKSSWNASVKARKAQDTPSQPVKRPAEITPASPVPMKKAKISDEPKKASSSFSSLLKKVSRPSLDASSKSKELLKVINASNGVNRSPGEKKDPKKGAMRVKWVDHFGGQLEAARFLEGEEGSADSHQADGVSWSDRKKRDRLREKELLSQVKKSKLLDDEDCFDMPKQMQATMEWRSPHALPDRPDVTKAQLESAEVLLQDERMRTLPRAQYASDYDVPNSPAPLSDVEQALDMTSQSSSVAAEIPFFVPEPVQPAPVPVPAPAPVVPYVDPNQVAQSALLHSLTARQSTAATPAFVQALGLPMFLVGQDVQALQTLASSPSLLSTLVDAHGMYDQARLLSLVQTLSSSSPPPPPPAFAGANDMYGMPPSASPYGQPPPFQAPPLARNGFRSTNSEGNLHVSGYGMGTTEADIIALFSPYVRVDEVVLKGTFAFVNTSDPMNANIARDALNGTLVGGMPIRINAAQRKSRDGPPPGIGSNPPPPRFPPPSFGQGAMPGQPPMQPPNMPGRIPGPPGVPLGGHPPPIVQNVDSVRDDRGNPATKNLFVAGYGASTTEAELRDLFGQHVNVIGVVSKGTFSFVNTESRESAVRAREGLGGLTVNGGVLRINFAKETGRLGTSFDLTYGKNTGPNASVRQGAPPPPQNMSYYGRGGY